MSNAKGRSRAQRRAPQHRARAGRHREAARTISELAGVPPAMPTAAKIASAGVIGTSAALAVPAAALASPAGGPVGPPLVLQQPAPPDFGQAVPFNTYGVTPGPNGFQVTLRQPNPYNPIPTTGADGQPGFVLPNPGFTGLVNPGFKGGPNGGPRVFQIGPGPNQMATFVPSTPPFSSPGDTGAGVSARGCAAFACGQVGSVTFWNPDGSTDTYYTAGAGPGIGWLGQANVVTPNERPQLGWALNMGGAAGIEGVADFGVNLQPPMGKDKPGVLSGDINLVPGTGLDLGGEATLKAVSGERPSFEVGPSYGVTGGAGGYLIPTYTWMTKTWPAGQSPVDKINADFEALNNPMNFTQQSFQAPTPDFMVHDPLAGPIQGLQNLQPVQPPANGPTLQQLMMQIPAKPVTWPAPPGTTGQDGGGQPGNGSNQSGPGQGGLQQQGSLGWGNSGQNGGQSNSGQNASGQDNSNPNGDGSQDQKNVGTGSGGSTTGGGTGATGTTGFTNTSSSTGTDPGTPGPSQSPPTQVTSAPAPISTQVTSAPAPISTQVTSAPAPISTQVASVPAPISTPMSTAVAFNGGVSGGGFSAGSPTQRPSRTRWPYAMTDHAVSYGMTAAATRTWPAPGFRLG